MCRSATRGWRVSRRRGNGFDHWSDSSQQSCAVWTAGVQIRQCRFLVWEFKMEHMTHEGHGQAAGPHAGMNMSGAHGSHDRHAGHSVAMFRDKFWLSFALTIPVVIWSTD